MAATPVTIFSDFACPASYVTEAALWSLDLTGLDLRFRAFELFPNGGTPGTYRFSDAEWARLQNIAADTGVEIRPRQNTPRTVKAHEAAVFARERELEIDLRREIFAALWFEDQDIGRIDVLAALAERVGIDRDDMRIALDIDRYQDPVEADQQLAQRLHIPGTPVVFIGMGRSAKIIAGAHDQEVLREAIEQWVKMNDSEIDGS